MLRLSIKSCKTNTQKVPKQKNKEKNLSYPQKRALAMRTSERRGVANTSLMDVAAPLYPFVDLNFHVLPRTEFTVSSLAAAVELCVQASHHGVAYEPDGDREREFAAQSSRSETLVDLASDSRALFQALGGAADGRTPPTAAGCF